LGASDPGIVGRADWPVPMILNFVNSHRLTLGQATGLARGDTADFYQPADGVGKGFP
jgi:hypothetical protein